MTLVSLELDGAGEDEVDDVDDDLAREDADECKLSIFSFCRNDDACGESFADDENDVPSTLSDPGDAVTDSKANSPVITKMRDAVVTRRGKVCVDVSKGIFSGNFYT